MDDTIQHSSKNTLLPRYGSRPTKPGMYLSLFHGRNSPTEKLNDWGFDGPMIGPLRWCHTTYACDVKLEFERAEDALLYFDKDWMAAEMLIDGDMLVYDGKYYGDWTVHYVPPEECERPPDGFRPVTRNNQCTAHRKSLSQM